MDEEIGNRFFQQAVDFWIKPEMIRRQKMGWKEKSVWAAQIILFPNRKPLVRLNNQTKIKIRTREGIIVEGVNITNLESTRINALILDPPVKDTADIYLILSKEKWIIKFDFRYYRDTAREQMNVAREFFESAKENLFNKRLRPFYEECWAVAELLSACNFLLAGFKYDNHHKNMEYMKSWAILENTKIEFSDALEELWELRSSARYLKSKEFEKQSPNKFVKILEEMFKATKRAIGDTKT